MFSRAISTIWALSFLAACGSGSQSAGDKFVERLDDHILIADKVLARPGTAFSAMPTGSSARFDGSAWVVIDPVAGSVNDDIAMIGDAYVVANFGTGTMTGSVSNLTAATDLTETSYLLNPVTREILIGQNFSFIGDDTTTNFTNLPNEWVADYVGRLSFDGNTFAVGGYVVGQFRGTRVSPTGGLSAVPGIGGIDNNGLASINGSSSFVPVYFEIFAENK